MKKYKLSFTSKECINSIKSKIISAKKSIDIEAYYFNPDNTGTEILNLLKANVGNEGEVLVEFNDSNAIFTFGDIILMCRLVDGKYPNYEAVIPKENPNVLTVDRAQFLSSIKRVSIFANKSTHQIKLHIAGSELSISAEDLDFNNESKERLTCSFDGDDMEIGFNARFLMEMLSNMESSEIKIQMSVPSRAGLLVPANNENENEDILMLVMPVMLNR